MREKYGEQLSKMQRNEDAALAVFEELFNFACPKFISPVAPNYDDPKNTSQVCDGIGFWTHFRDSECLFDALLCGDSAHIIQFC